MAHASLFLLWVFLSGTLATLVQYNFNVANGKVAPDGVTRDAVLVNNLFPGPLIRAEKGDTLRITVNNGLNDPTMRQSTSIHWHGLFQVDSVHEDGPAFVTQVSTSLFTTETKVVTGTQTGTYWYHSHLSAQYVDGLRGPLVIYAQDPYYNSYDVDDDSTIFTLADWYHTSSEAIKATGDFLKTVPDAGTINGKGRFSELNMTASPNTLHTFRVQPNKRYRLRLINTSAIAAYRFGIQGHKLTVIEADGILTRPIEVDQLDLLAGQRYSVILKANQKPDTYWINAPITNVLNTTVQALLMYETIPPYQLPQGPYWTWSPSPDVWRFWHDPHWRPRPRLPKRSIDGTFPEVTPADSHLTRRATGNPTESHMDASKMNAVVLDESKLIPLQNPGAPGGSRQADVVVPVNFAPTANGKWVINNITYTSPSVPTLLKILSKQGDMDNSDFAPTENVFPLPHDRVIELVINGTTRGIIHPFHLHGHAFDIVQFGNAPPNYVNPPRRDVVGVTETGVRIRFKTDNAGPWFLHCHIDWHLEEGLAMVFVESPWAIRNKVKPDPTWYNLCRKYNALAKEFQ